MTRAWRVAVATEGALLVGLALWWAFREYGGLEAATFLTAAPYPCPWHPWR